MIYRQKTGKDVWHWCQNCSNWPTSKYRELDLPIRPSSGELCNECRHKEEKDNCTN